MTLTSAPQRDTASLEAKAITPPTEVLPATDGKPERIDNDPLGELDARARVAMMRWMAANPQYEYVMHDYCHCRTMPETNCPEYEAERMRQRSEYHYADVGDYNEDGRQDFAIILARKGKEGPDRFIIFNGPFDDDVPTPAFSVDGLELRDQVHNGYLGISDSDNGYSFKAKGKTYELEYVGNPQ